MFLIRSGKGDFRSTTIQTTNIQRICVTQFGDSTAILHKIASKVPFGLIGIVWQNFRFRGKMFGNVVRHIYIYMYKKTGIFARNHITLDIINTYICTISVYVFFYLKTYILSISLFVFAVLFCYVLIFNLLQL